MGADDTNPAKEAIERIARTEVFSFPTESDGDPASLDYPDSPSRQAEFKYVTRAEKGVATGIERNERIVAAQLSCGESKDQPKQVFSAEDGTLDLTVAWAIARDARTHPNSQEAEKAQIKERSKDNLYFNDPADALWTQRETTYLDKGESTLGRQMAWKLITGSSYPLDYEETEPAKSITKTSKYPEGDPLLMTQACEGELGDLSTPDGLKKFQESTIQRK